MAFQQQHTSSSLSKVSIQLQCPSQTFVSTRRSPYSTSSKGSEDNHVPSSYSTFTPMVSTTSPSYFLQPVKISLAKRSDETNSLPPIDSSIKIDPRNKKTKNNNRVVGIDGSSEGFPADDKCHDDQDQDKQPIRNTPPDKAAQITNLQHTQKRPLLSDKRKNSSVVFSSENGSVSIEDLDRAYEQAKKSWGTSSAAAGNNKLGKPMGGQFSSYNLLWKENSLHRIKSSSIEDYSDRRQNRGNRIRRFRNAYNQQIERLKRKRIPQRNYSLTSSAIENSDNGNAQRFSESLLNHRVRKWAFWFIVLCLAALTVKDVVNLIIEYSGSPKKSDMNIRFNDSMSLPNLTFCMSRAQAWSHFQLNMAENITEWEKKIQESLEKMKTRERFLSEQWDYRMVVEAYNLVSTLTSIERETTARGIVNSIHKFRVEDRLAEIRRMSTFWLGVVKARNVSFEEFTQKVGKETLRYSIKRFERTTTEDGSPIANTRLHITWISQSQICFQPIYSKESYRDINEQGTFFIMVLAHNPNNLNGKHVDCMSVDFHGRPSSSIRFMGDKGIIKDGFNDELCIGLMHETTVDVRARYRMLENTESGTACKDSVLGEDNEYDCYLRCRLNHIKDMCKCTAPTLSYLVPDEITKFCDYSQCILDVQGKNYSENEDCSGKCFRNCDQFRYRINHVVKGKSVRPDLTTIMLNWGSFEYLTLEQQLQYTPTSFIGTVGGAIGMWLGLSILSLIQGTTYMYGYVADTIAKKKRSASTSSVQTKDTACHSDDSTAVSKLKSALERLEAERLAANPLDFPYPYKKRNSTK